ncbi:HAD-IA family hydrolase [Streptomyces gamaensis]|uniref:HAD-IA family hydrolase n=1 Tax=Streptomyces gamaensis TaxID=1763542 RepID=A0ABW0YXV4_9ACTN
MPLNSSAARARAVTGRPPDAVTAVVFDLDGVLIDSFAVMREAFAVAYREVVGDGEPPFEEYVTHQGRYFPDIMRLMGLPPAMQEPFVRESHRLMHRVEVYPGVPRLLADLRAGGIRTAIATGKSGERARAVLAAVGLLPLLDAVVGSDEVPRPKPHPDIVREALGRIGAAAGEALMVGDAVIDLQSGRAAGTRTVAATWGEGRAEQLRAQRPDFVLDSPGLLLSLVRGGGGA